MAHDPAIVKGDPAEPCGAAHVDCTVRNIGRGFFINPDDFHRWVRNAGFFPMENSFFWECVDECIGRPIREGCDRAEVWSNPSGCTINLSRLEREIGESRQKWSLAKRSLIDSRVLIQDEDGGLWINMHLEEWIYPSTGKPRLTALKLAYGEAAQPHNVAATQAQLKFARERINPFAPHRTIIAPHREPAGPSVVDFEAPRRDQDTPASRPGHPRVETRTPAASRPVHLSPAPIEERPRGVLDPAEKERGGVEAQPPASDSNFVSGKVEPWASPEAGQDYRAMAQARPEPATSQPPIAERTVVREGPPPAGRARALGASEAGDGKAAGRPRSPARAIGREGPSAVRFNPVGLVARLKAKGLLSTEGRHP